MNTNTVGEVLERRMNEGKFFKCSFTTTTNTSMGGENVINDKNSSRLVYG